MDSVLFTAEKYQPASTRKLVDARREDTTRFEKAKNEFNVWGKRQTSIKNHIKTIAKSNCFTVDCYLPASTRAAIRREAGFLFTVLF